MQRAAWPFKMDRGRKTALKRGAHRGQGYLDRLTIIITIIITRQFYTSSLLFEGTGRGWRMEMGM